MYYIREKEGKNEILKIEGKMSISILITIHTVHCAFLKMYTEFKNTGSNRSWEIWAYTSYSRSRNSPACSLHIYWYSVRLSSLLPFYKICMIFQLSSAYSTHQAEQNKHFSPFFGVKLTMPPSSGYSVSFTKINYSRWALVIWSSLQLTSTQWSTSKQFTAGADLFLK